MNNVFITGGTSGIGLELAKVYLKNGFRVGVCGRDEAKFNEAFPTRRDDITFFKVDVVNRDEVKRAIAEFSRPTGLDILIASAGIGYKYKTKLPDFDYTYKMVNTNLLGLMYAFEAALEVMVPQGHGHLVGVASLAGFVGLPGVSGYSATKAAVQKYCESLSMDLTHFNVNVTCVNPGFIDTPLTKGNHHPMPFLMQAPVAAEGIFHAIRKKKVIYTFPAVMGFVLKLLSILPRFFYRRMMGVKALNYSRRT